MGKKPRNIRLTLTPRLFQRLVIFAKIKANGVEVYSLEIVPNADVKESEGKIVGSCNNSTQKIVYKRGVAPTTAG